MKMRSIAAIATVFAEAVMLTQVTSAQTGSDNGPQPSLAQQVLPWAYPTPTGRGGFGGGSGGRGGGGRGGSGGGRGPGGGAANAFLQHINGSDQAFTTQQINSLNMAVDWFPNDHPPAPEIVTQGRTTSPSVGACGHCHLPNGLGRPENAPLAGLPADYIVQEVHDFAHSLRHSVESRLPGADRMSSVATAATDDEVKIAADYFASIEFTQRERVVETDTVPVTRAGNGEWQIVEDGGAEPIGNRIMEIPEDEAAFNLRDTRSGYIAYVPKGAIARGAAKATSCKTCHGPDLKGQTMPGVGVVPPLAGRSPEYEGRQMFDFQQGTRTGKNSPIMKAAVTSLKPEDIVDILAYSASLKP